MNIIGPIAALIAIAIIAGASLKGCSMANEAYYALANKCIQDGGSWVPNGNQASWSGICIRGAR